MIRIIVSSLFVLTLASKSRSPATQEPPNTRILYVGGILLDRNLERCHGPASLTLASGRGPDMPGPIAKHMLARLQKGNLPSPSKK